jgi:DNA polymerase-1
MILLVDADILLYRMCFAHEKVIDWGDGVTSNTADIDTAQKRIRSMVRKMAKFCHCEELTMCLTGRKNFRYNVYPDYKANRVSQNFEMIKPLRQWIEDSFNSLCIPMLEADDAMGVRATSGDAEYVIATIDKDLLQIPGRHYNWNSNKRQTISKKDADHFFYIQILTGDTTDNYFGVPGIGPVKAAKVLKENDKKDWWTAIVAEYEAKNLTEEYALQMARVARILRAEDFNLETEEPILWTPKGVN